MSSSLPTRPQGIFLPGLAKQNPGLGRQLKDRFGYSAHRTGDDFVIPFTDPAIRRGISDVLKIGPVIDLKKKTNSEVAKDLCSRVPSDFDEYKHELPKKISVASGYGIFDLIDKITLELTITPKAEIEKYVCDFVIPSLQKEFEFDYVTSISVDPGYFQSLVSFSKIVYLIEEFWLKDAEKKLFQDKALGSILPNPLSLLEYMNAFLLFSPFAVALPFDRPGCVWYFWKDGLIAFPHAVTHSILEEFKNNHNPLSETSTTVIFGGITFTKDNIWNYLRLLTFCLNNIIKYACDLKNFKNAAGDFDSYRCIQTISGLNLLFSDLLSLNTTSDTFLRAHFSFTAIEKITNLRKEIGGSRDGEGVIAQKLLSLHQGRWVRRELTKVLGSRWPTLTAEFARMTKAFADIHRDTKRQMDKGGMEEKNRLQVIRSQRNVIIHGTFLSKDQFKNAYVLSRGAFPSQIPTISLLLCLAMMANPRDFFTFSPSVKGL